MAYESTYGTRGEDIINQGGKNVFTLNGGYNIIRAWIDIDATVTITGATGGALGTPVGDAAIANLASSKLARKIRVLASPAAGSRYPKGPLVDCTPRSLLRFAMTQREGKLVGDLLANGSLGGGANGAYQIFTRIPIYFGDELNLNGVQTALNMNGADSTGRPVYKTVQVVVDWAQALGELFEGTTGAFTINGMVRYGDERLDLSAGDTVPLFQEDHEAIIRGAQQQFPDQLLPQNGAFMQWLIMAEQGQPGYTLSDAIMEHLQVNGAGAEYEMKWQEMRQDMLDEGYFDPSQTLTGLFFKDWTHGTYQNAINAAQLSAFYRVLNPSGSGLDQLRVYTRRIMSLLSVS